MKKNGAFFSQLKVMFLKKGFQNFGKIRHTPPGQKIQFEGASLCFVQFAKDFCCSKNCCL